MNLTVLFGIAAVIGALYLGVRLAGDLALAKLIEKEYEHVLTCDEHRVKGRFE